MSNPHFEVILPSGNPVKLIDLPSGALFRYKSTMAVKSEYFTDAGAVKAFIVGHGELFWGRQNSVENLNNLLVQPLKIVLMSVEDLADYLWLSPIMVKLY